MNVESFLAGFSLAWFSVAVSIFLAGIIVWSWDYLLSKFKKKEKK
ncbi:hypothetical protein [Campylobacter vulpis]|nr:hypothetical protein [Campylobacter vulpis]